MTKEELIKVFDDTKEYSSNMVDSVTTLHTFKDIVKCNNFNVDTFKMLHSMIVVVNSDSVSALSRFNTGKTCILNMASAKRPGGGVANGRVSQEECLFRCSNLTNVISTELYPLNDYQGIYTKNAIFFKDNCYNYMKEIVADVVTVAAINLNNDSNNPNYENITKQKIRLMLSLAIENCVDNIILSAFGCGVFKNDPKIISQYFYDILVTEKYSENFNTVMFAIINDDNSTANNYQIFKDMF